jgi:hypothetical protein
MRSVVLELMTHALGGFIAPAHTARAQASAHSAAVISPSPVNGLFSVGDDTGLATNADLGPLGLAMGLNSALNLADGVKISSFSH